MKYTPKQLAEFMEKVLEAKKEASEDNADFISKSADMWEKYRQAAALLRKLEWQPIETAKEGQTILCWGQDFDFMQVADLQESGEWRMFEYDGGCRVCLFPPTHWLPLDIFQPPTNEND